MLRTILTILTIPTVAAAILALLLGLALYSSIAYLGH